MYYFFVFVVFFSSTSKAERWSSYNSFDYFFGSEVSNLEIAKTECQVRNSNLVVIKNSEIQSFLISVITEIDDNADYYIGLQRISTKKEEFIWVDNTTVSSSYTDWAHGEPNNYGDYCECCAFMWKYRKFKWSDDICAHPARYICQRKISLTSTNSTYLAIPQTSVMSKWETLTQLSNMETSLGKNVTQNTKRNDKQAKRYFPIYLIPILVAVVLLLLLTIIFLTVRRKRQIKPLQTLTYANPYENEYSEANVQVPNQTTSPTGEIQNNQLNSIYTVAEDTEISNDHFYTAVNKSNARKKHKTSSTSQHNESIAAEYGNIEHSVYGNITQPQNSMDLNLQSSQAVYNVLDQNR